MRITKKSFRRWFLPVTLLGCVWLSFASPTHAQSDDLTGTYKVDGTKGAIVLSLRQDEKGGAEGTLKGGDLALVLKGFAATGGGVFGTASKDTGGFVTYFQAKREGGTVHFDFVPADAGGDPDLAQAQRFEFKIGEVAAAPLRNGSAPVPNLNPASRPAVISNGLFAGRWQGDGLVFDSKAQGSDYLGSLVLSNQKMPFTATALNGKLLGTFQTNGERYDFQGTIQGNSLILTSGNSTYRLFKPAAANPLAKPKNSLAKPENPLSNHGKPLAKKLVTKKPATAKKPVVKRAVASTAVKAAPVARVQLAGAPQGGAAWKVFKHPVGLSLRYPPTWMTRNVNGILLLSPPNVKQIAGGPAEVFLVTADSAAGITAGNDPRLETGLEQYVARNFPTFTRSGATKSIRAGNQPGILMNWEGTAQGYPGRLQILSTILKGFSVSVVAISSKDEIKASRDFTVNQIFQSLVAGAGARDPNVVGKWFLYSYKGSGYSTSGSFGSETKSYMTLLPDGTALWGAKSETSWSGRGTDSVGNEMWNAGGGGQGNSIDKGQWSAGNGQLIIAWGDGTTAVWTYSVGRGNGGNRRLMLKGSKPKPDEWMEIR